MARNAVLLVLSVVFAVTFHSGARGQGPSPAPLTVQGPSTVTAPQPPAPSTTEMPPAPGPGASSDCMTTLTGDLYSCLSYVEAGSNLTRPEKGCCQGFAMVVNNQPLCLCSLVSNTEVYGIHLDHTKSLMLPTVCRVQTPPISLCSAIGAPVSSPEGSTPGAAPVEPTLPAAAASPAAFPPTGSGAEANFRSSALALLAGLSFATVSVV